MTTKLPKNMTLSHAIDAFNDGILFRKKPRELPQLLIIIPHTTRLQRSVREL